MDCYQVNILLIVPRVPVKFSSRTGVGTYYEGVLNVFREIGAHVDVIFDDVPVDNVDYFKYISDDHFRTEEIHSLTRKIIPMLSKKVYECVICSTMEGIFSCIGAGINNLIPVYYRPHNTSFVFDEEVPVRIQILRGLIANVPNIKLLALCNNIRKMLHDLYNQKCPVVYNYISDLADYAQSWKRGKQEGVLYISRYADDKNVERFANLIEETGLPAKIMTSSPTAASRWKSLLGDADVRYGLQGKEKFDFIASSKIAVSVSLRETFGNGIVESVPFCKTIILKQENNWHRNFKELPIADHLSVASDGSFNSIVEKWYRKKYHVDAYECAQSYIEKSKRSWVDFLKDETKYPNVGRSGKSELSKLLDSGSVVDWQEFASDQQYRKIRQVYAYKYNIGLKTKGSRIRKA